MEERVEDKEVEGIVEGENEGGLRVAFWNVAGLGNKDMEFWEAFRDRDIIFLMETWLDEKGWDKIRGRLPTGFR